MEKQAGMIYNCGCTRFGGFWTFCEQHKKPVQELIDAANMPLADLAFHQDVPDQDEDVPANKKAVLIIVYDRPCHFLRGRKIGQVGKNLTDEELNELLVDESCSFIR